MRAGHRARGLATLAAAALVASMLSAVPAGAASPWVVTPSANPVFASDAPDPHAVRFGSTFYAYTTGTTWGNHIGVLKSSSPNRGWQVVGSALPTVPSWQQIDTENAPGVFRWAGHYIMYYNAKPLNGAYRCISVATSNTPEGPFVDSTSAPIQCFGGSFGGAIDASPFVDRDGKPYLYFKNNDGFTGSPAVSSVWVVPLSADALQVAGSPQWVMSKDDSHPPGNTVDNPQMVLIGGIYYLFFTGGDYLDASYAMGYAVCQSRAGPCSRPLPGPVLSTYGSVFGPGGGSVFSDASGRYWLAYHAYTDCASNCGGHARRLFVARIRQPLTWEPWERLDADLVGDPAATSRTTNRLDVVARNADGGIWRRQWNGGSWTAWNPLGGVPAGDPAIVSRTAKSLDVLVRGTDGRLWRKVLNDTTWSPWVRLPGGAVAGDPAVASWGAKRLDVFVRGTGNQLQHEWWNGSSWSGWETLDGTFTGDPAVVSRGVNQLDVFVRGTDDQLRHRSWNGSSWSGWETLGGVTLEGDPAVASWSASRIDVFARGIDDRLQHRWFDGSRWSGWETLGSGVLAGDPTAVSWAPGRIDVFARADDDHLLHKSFF